MADGERDQLRLFVACGLPDDVRQALARIQDDLRQLNPPALRWVRPEGIHLTLKFLGAVSRDRLDRVVEALDSAIEPFDLTVRAAKLGGFGGTRLRVIWVGLDGDVEALAALAGGVDTAMAGLGFPKETRPFRSHLTLARVQERASAEDRRRLASLIERYDLPEIPAMRLAKVDLMESTLGRGGAVYRRLASVPGSAA